MNRKITVGTSIALIFFAALLAFTATYVFVNKSYQIKMDKYLEYSSKYQKLYNFDSIVREEYIGAVDDDAVIDGMLHGYLNGLGDKYADYMNSEEFSKYMLEMSGKAVGIGVTVHFNSDANAIEIVFVSDDSPAQGAGLQAGDLILGVGELTVASDGYNAVVDAIAGKVGDSVTITVKKADTGIVSELSFVRAEVSYSSVYSRVHADKIGIVQITEFNNSTPDEFKTAMEELKTAGISAFIFDVRNNLGGDLDAICSVLDYMLPEGPIVRLVDADGNERVVSSDASCIEADICVLVNNYTASAAELFAAAIRDYKYGALFGTKTFGKGTAQTVKRLPDNSALFISTELYMPPFGDNYEGVGVTPDTVIEYKAGVGGKEDSQTQKAIDVLLDILKAKEDVE